MSIGNQVARILTWVKDKWNKKTSSHFSPALNANCIVFYFSGVFQIIFQLVQTRKAGNLILLKGQKTKNKLK